MFNYAVMFTDLAFNYFHYEFLCILFIYIFFIFIYNLFWDIFHKVHHHF